MKIDVHSPHDLLTERLQRYVTAMTREVLRGFEQDSLSISVRLRRDPMSATTRRVHCDLRLQRRDGTELVFDGVGTFPHVAVERALEQLWQILRSKRHASSDGRAA